MACKKKARQGGEVDKKDKPKMRQGGSVGGKMKRKKTSTKKVIENQGKVLIAFPILIT